MAASSSRTLTSSANRQTGYFLFDALHLLLIQSSVQQEVLLANKKRPLNSRSISTDGSSVTPAVLELANAVNEYRYRYDQPFPTWSEVLGTPP